ncbi:MAG: tetratricopeptide repeat protein, partial [Gemmatimonadales bacterium]
VAMKRAALDSLRKQTATPAIAQQIDTLQAEVSEIATRLNDTEKTMAISFRNAGMPDSAEALEGRLIARFSATNLDSLETGDLLTVGVAAFNAGKYPDAERAFGKAAERNPWSRDARYNLSITHLAVSRQAKDTADGLRRLARTWRTEAARARVPDSIKARVADTAKLDTDMAAAYRKLVAEATHLVEIDPMNEDVLRLLAQGYRGLNQDAEAYKTAERLVALPFSVEITVFQMGMTKAMLAADCSGRNPTDPEGKPLKVGPMTLVFEFLDAKGTVVDSKEVSVPVLSNGQKHSIEVEGKAAEITAWRYRPKPA